jgi:hypothetical protein
MVFPLHEKDPRDAPIRDFNPIDHKFKRIVCTSPDIVHLVQEKVPASYVSELDPYNKIGNSSIDFCL